MQYFAVRGESSGFAERIEMVKEHGTPVAEFIDYILDRGPGGYESLSEPKQVEAESFEQAALRVASASNGPLDLVIEEPTAQPDEHELDKAVVEELVRDAGRGAYIRLRGNDWSASDTATTIAMWCGPPANVFSYLPFPLEIPPMPGLKFVVESIERTEPGWKLTGRAVAPSDCPATEVAVEPVREQAVLREIERAVEALPDEVVQALEEHLKRETNPTMV
jgi:hypothetical protein